MLCCVACVVCELCVCVVVHVVLCVVLVVVWVVCVHVVLVVCAVVLWWCVCMWHVWCVGCVCTCGVVCGVGGTDEMLMTMSLAIPSHRHAPNWSGRTPGSLTPGVSATPSPRQRRTLRHRGLKNGHSRPCGRSAKNAAKCGKNHRQTS